MLSSTTLTLNIRHQSFNVMIAVSEEDAAQDTTVYKVTARPQRGSAPQDEESVTQYMELPSNGHPLTIIEDVCRLLREELA